MLQGLDQILTIMRSGNYLSKLWQEVERKKILTCQAAISIILFCFQLGGIAGSLRSLSVLLLSCQKWWFALLGNI